MVEHINVAPLNHGLSGDVDIPGDKSISHRSVILGGLAQGETHVRGLLEGEDVHATIGVMRALGATLDRIGPGEWLIHGLGEQPACEPDDVLPMGNSGTSARLLCGVLGACPITSFMTGDQSLRRRPMNRVTQPLSLMGIRFVAREGGRLPMAIRGTSEIRPLHHKIAVPSAQVKSSLMLAALAAKGTTTLIEPVLTRDHTENMMRYFGADLQWSVHDNQAKTITIEGGVILQGKPVDVPADPSSAAFIVAAALIVPESEVTIENVGLNPLRAEIFNVFKEMGAKIEIYNVEEKFGETIGTLHVRSGPLKAVDVAPSRAPSLIDEYPILSVVAAMSSGQSHFRGLGELRVKESDRLTAIARMLRDNGVHVAVEGDDLIIDGKGSVVRGGGLVHSRGDHRLAMSAAILGLVASRGVMIDDVSCINTSFPGFADVMNRLGAGFTFS